jgi:hypothetical protein
MKIYVSVKRKGVFTNLSAIELEGKEAQAAKALQGWLRKQLAEKQGIQAAKAAIWMDDLSRAQQTIDDLD